MLMISLALLIGCEAECQSDTRMNGDYAVWSYVTAPTDELSGENLTEYPWPGMFFNGWSEWTLEFVSGQGSVKLEIDDQPFTADFQRPPEDCRDFTLDFAGTYLTSAGSTHSFLWTGEMAYQGPHITGVWSYQDTWANTALDQSGSVVVPEGEISLTRGGAVEDTGG